MINPVGMIAAAVFCLLVCFGLPVALFIVVRKKLGGRLVPLLSGAAVFFLFALVLEQLLHLAAIELGLLSWGTLPYVLYAALAAGVFEETGRFVAFHILKKSYHRLGDALAYGIGHGGIEAVVVTGISMSAALFAGGMGMLSATTGPELIFVAGLERLFAIALHIALSVAVFYAVNERGKGWLYPLAILLHAVADVPAALYQRGRLPLLWTEALTFVAAAGCVVFAIALVRKRSPKAAEDTVSWEEKTDGGPS